MKRLFVERNQVIVLIPERQCSTALHDRAGLPQRGARTTHPFYPTRLNYPAEALIEPAASLYIASIINHAKYQF